MSKPTKAASSVAAVEAKLAVMKNTSTKIRYLASLNMTRGAIAKQLNVRYQHVRNVLITPVTNQAEKF